MTATVGALPSVKVIANARVPAVFKIAQNNNRTGPSADRRGENSPGEAGLGTARDINVPVAASREFTFTIADRDNAATCGLERSLGDPRCWGPDGSGQVGDGTTPDRTVCIRERF